MSNHTSFKRVVFIKPSRLEYSRLGWQDARQGLPFHHKYDTWAEWAQKNYETGRLRAVNVRAAGMVPASYHKLKKSTRADGKTNHMPRITQQYVDSIQAVGNPFPRID